jgi:hypothetical protein
MKKSDQPVGSWRNNQGESLISFLKDDLMISLWVPTRLLLHIEREEKERETSGEIVKKHDVHMKHKVNALE